MAKNIDVIMPLMGEGVNEATVVKWLKKVGEKIEKDEPLLEISTDKVDTEIPAPASGFLIASFAKENESIFVDQVIAQISDDPKSQPTQPTSITKNASNKETPSKANQSPTQSNPQERRSTQPVPHSVVGQMSLPATYAGSVRTSPLVRKMAKDLGVSLQTVNGSGLYGRITKNDLVDHLHHGGTRVAAVSHEPQSPQVDFNPQSKLFKVETKTVNNQELLEGVVVRREKMSKMRWLTAEHMLRSVRTSPHVTTTFEMDLNQISIHREQNKEKFLQDHGVNLTFTTYFIQAAIHAIKQYPIVNASVDGDDILYKDDINIGCAVAIESGLIVPVIKKANEFNLADCAKALNDIATRARNKKLKPDDVSGGTFSITNPGMFGSLHSQPIINQPQVAILSVGAIIKRPVVINNDITIRPLCQIGLTFDHRIIDGEGGAKFLRAMQEFLENYK